MVGFPFAKPIGILSNSRVEFEELKFTQKKPVKNRLEIPI
jgi:hypothetical protein